MKSIWPKNLSYSISRKILASLLIISGIITTIITAVQISFDYFDEVRDLNQELSMIEQGYKKSVTNSLWELHIPQLQSQLEGIMTIGGIRYAEVSDGNKVIAAVGEIPKSEQMLKSFSLTYDNGGNLVSLGHLKVYASLEPIKQKLYKKVFVIFAMQFLKTLLVSFLIYLVIQQLVTRHLIDISDYLSSLNLNSIKKSLKLNRTNNENADMKDELDNLADNINSMREELDKSYSELNKLNHQLEEKVNEKTHELIQQRQQLEFASKMSTLGEMAGGIAHEINTPLAAISLNVEVLLQKIEKGQDIDKEFLLKTLHRNQKTVRKIAQIIQGLRTFSRDGSNDDYELISVKYLVNETVTLCQEKITYNQVLLKSSGIPENLSVRCRHIQASQVLLNLINNAYDAIINLPEKWIHIDAYEDDKNTYISVTDSGPGVPKDLKQKIFEPFFTTKDVGKGTGLGLSISRSIMQQHGGSLILDDNAANTRFVMIFPKNNLSGSF